VPIAQYDIFPSLEHHYQQEREERAERGMREIERVNEAKGSGRKRIN